METARDFIFLGSKITGYGLFSSHVWSWELDHKEGRALKNWYFQTVVLEKTLESPLDSKIKPVTIKGNQPWILIRRTNAEAETPILWPPDVNSWLIWKDPDDGKDWRQKEKRVTEDEDGWMASRMQWTWTWANSRKWWGTGRPGMLQSMWSRRVWHDWQLNNNNISVNIHGNRRKDNIIFLDIFFYLQKVYVKYCKNTQIAYFPKIGIFFGHSVVKTPLFHCTGHGFHLWSGN